MDWIQFSTLYVFGGLLLTAFILLFPEAYVNNLRYAVIILKTVSLKRKNQEDKKIPPPAAILKQEQEKYTREFDNKIQEESEATSRSRYKFNLTLVKMIILWPLVAFIFILAAVLKFFYLEEQDLP